MGCGQAVRRLPLEQETVGSNPTIPATRDLDQSQICIYDTVDAYFI